MLALYLFMVSRLIIGRQLNEIALLTSRGGSRIKIIFIYFIEVLLLGALAFMIGPALGALLVKVLGASNGFLEFVQRSALPVNIVPTAYIYAFLTVMASVVMIMLPVYFASGQSIVHHKQKLARTAGKQRWYMVILDLALLGAALYGLIAYNRQQTVTGSRPDLFIDPALFFIPALFIIGFGLLVLRVYPVILTAIYKLGERLWSVSLYSTLLQVSRSAKQYQFLMLFFSHDDSDWRV